MGGWIFARDKQAEQTLGDVVTAGSKQIALAGADGIFSPGELLFISEADGSEAEFLGAVTAVSPTAVDFAFGLRASKNSGALLWRPAESLNAGGEAAAPFQTAVRPGVRVERSLGAASYAVRTAEPRSEIEWTLTGLTPALERALIDWIDTKAAGGLNAFTLVSLGRDLLAVRLGGEGYTRRTERGGRVAVTLALHLEAEDQYR